MSHDFRQPRWRGGQLHLLLRRHRLLAKPSRRAQRHVLQDPSWVQVPGGGPGLGPILRPVPPPPQREAGHTVRSVSRNGQKFEFLKTELYISTGVRKDLEKLFMLINVFC